MAGIWLYSESQEKKESIAMLCKSLSLGFGEITKTDFAGTVRKLIGKNKQRTGRNFSSYPEIMLFDGLSEAQLDDFLAVYREREIAPISCKAIVTSVNLNWNLMTLAQELEKEHQKMI